MTIKMYMSDLVALAKTHGFEPALNSSGKSMRVLRCPKCQKISLAIFEKGSQKIRACPCGYRSKTTWSNQCKAYTKKGKRCTYKAKKGSDYCGIHGSD